MINISEQDLSIVKQILRQYLVRHNVWAFGSRINNTARDFSDLDLAIEDVTGSKINPDIIFQIQSDFRESDLPVEVDVVDLNAVSPEFKEIITANKIAINYIS